MTQIEISQKKSIPKKWNVIGLITSILMVVSSILLFLYPFASKEESKYFHSKNPILFNEKVSGNVLIEGENVYLPISFVKEHIDESIIFDEKSQSIIITTQDKVVQMPTESLTYYVNEKPVKLHLPVIQSSNGEMFVSIEPLLGYYPIQYKKLKETNAIWIQKNGDTLVRGRIKNKEVHEEKFRLRKEATLQSPFVDQVKRNEWIYIEGESEEYLFIRKENGNAGYLYKSLIQKGDQEEILIKQEKKTADIPKLSAPIQLTWEAVYNRNPDTKKLPEMPGINVVSPTWFELENADGNIKNLGSLDYVKWAHSKKYQVWGLFSNAFDPELSHLAFKDYETRQKMIRQLLHYSKIYHLNGINLDIENVNVEDGPFITQFVREATPLFHEAGLTVSMDITFISTSGNWSMFYERDKLGKVVDYLIVMAYDEHWGSSPIAGSVASLPWVETNIKKLLNVVPNDKLVLGVPLYTRLWKEEVQSDGTVNVSSEALSMAKVKKWLNDNRLKPQYDSVTGQNYAELTEKNGKITYKVWLEDEVSLRKRADLVVKYQLAGIASWSRFFGDETAWTAMQFDNKYTNADKK